MKLGIFSKTYSGNVNEVFKKMNLDGIHHTQFNMASVTGYDTMPAFFVEKDLDNIANCAKQNNISIDAISGTFNMIDPDDDLLEENRKRFEILCEIAHFLNIPIITLCTGSRNPESKWKWSDENTTTNSWNILLETTEAILKHAQKFDIILGVEIEASNIINTPLKAKQYFDFFQSKHLKIVMDYANLITSKNVEHSKIILHTAFSLLGKEICLAHGKDFIYSDHISFVAPGEGMLDYKEYISYLKSYQYNGPFIMHGLNAHQVKKSVSYLRGIDNEL